MWIHFLYQLNELWIIEYYVNANLCCILPIFAKPSQFPSPTTIPNIFHYVAYSSNTIIFTGDIYIHLPLWRHGVCIATRFPRKAALTGDADIIADNSA